ncbi:MAG: tetratricopeptide repeat protein, partial [Nitrososphaeraceae archaeon]|nr:tetratricopeptide repeat protein [Nitrososphaeraceae archaeon]
MLDESQSEDKDKSSSISDTSVDSSINTSNKMNSGGGSNIDEINNGERSEYLQAIRHLDKLLTLNPSDPATYFDKGFILEILEKFQEAIKCFDDALKIKPNY